MCGFAPALMAAGLALQTYGAYTQSQNQKAAYEYQAQVERNNATFAEYQAQEELRRGEEEELSVRRRTAALKGSQRASLAARGLDITEGSALNILTDTDYLGEQDALTVRDNAAKRAYAARVQGSNYSANAGLLDFRASAENPLLAGAGTLLSGAGQVADSWYRYKSSSSSIKPTYSGGSSSVWA